MRREGQAAADGDAGKQGGDGQFVQGLHDLGSCESSAVSCWNDCIVGGDRMGINKTQYFAAMLSKTQ
ncbi:hypothetical protein GCM10027296_17620 [Chitinimonas naiadis]